MQRKEVFIKLQAPHIPRQWTMPLESHGACVCCYAAECAGSHVSAALFEEGRLASCRKVHPKWKKLATCSWPSVLDNICQEASFRSLISPVFFQVMRMAWAWWGAVGRKWQRTVIKSFCPLSLPRPAPPGPVSISGHAGGEFRSWRSRQAVESSALLSGRIRHHILKVGTS